MKGPPLLKSIFSVVYKYCSVFVPKLQSQHSYCPSFQFSLSKILSQFLYRPSFGSSFFVLAQVLHQVYGGGILAVIMHGFIDS